MNFGLVFDKFTERFRQAVYGYNVREQNYRALEIDPINWGLHVIESEHHEIHEASSFTAYYTITTAATDGHRTGIYLKTPPKDSNTKKCHMIAAFAASTAANLSICEGVTIAADVGTHTSPILNRYRDVAKASGCFNNATAPAQGFITTLTQAQIAGAGTFNTGTVIRQEPMRTGDSPKPAGGATRGAQEYILKTDTPYVFLLTNTSASANTHFILLDWYEHRKFDH